MKYKLYVWEGEGVLEQYGTGLIAVLASSLDEALKLIKEKCSYAMDSFPVNDYRIIDKPEAFISWGSD